MQLINKWREGFALLKKLSFFPTEGWYMRAGEKMENFYKCIIYVEGLDKLQIHHFEYLIQRSKFQPPSLSLRIQIVNLNDTGFAPRQVLPHRVRPP